MGGNIFGGYYNKSDLYGTANANRIGNWWEHFGTLCYANVIRYTDIANDFDGIGTLAAPQDPLFVDDRSGHSSGTYHYNANSGTGGGDYRLQTGSPAIGILPANTRHTITDLNGVIVPNDGTADAGAYQHVTYVVTGGSATVAVDTPTESFTLSQASGDFLGTEIITIASPDSAITISLGNVDNNGSASATGHLEEVIASFTFVIQWSTPGTKTVTITVAGGGTSPATFDVEVTSTAISAIGSGSVLFPASGLKMIGVNDDQ